MPFFHYFSLRRFGAVVAAFSGGCATCYFLRTNAGFGAVSASALTGLAGTFLPVPPSRDKAGVQAAVYSGSFAGMCSAEIIGVPAHIILVSLLGGVVWLVMTPLFPGVGGKLGAIAFATTAIILLVKVLS